MSGFIFNPLFLLLTFKGQGNIEKLQHDRESKRKERRKTKQNKTNP